jgi:hypothetical protein
MTKKIPVSVDFAKYRHIWCIGCSFTQYKTNTWADILAKYYPVTNLGRSGAGNQYIFQTLWELEISGTISSNDLIMVQWSSVFRESRRYKGDWLTGGNLWTQETYPNDFIKNFCDPNEFFHRDMSLIRATQKGLLDRYSHYEFSMAPLTLINQYHNKQFNMDTDYSKIHDRLLPSFYEVLWNNDIRSRGQFYHPTPEEHLVYLQKVFGFIIPN